MAKKSWFFCVVIALSVGLAYAVEVNTKASVPPAPLFKDPVTGMEMLYVKGGCFQMGALYGDGFPEEQPVHEVCVDDFYMGKYEVKQGQWKSIMGSNSAPGGTCPEDNCPVGTVSWNDVQNFISKLNSTNGGSKYRLPTEAEWEYAARSGGKNERYAGGNDVDSVAWYLVNSGNKGHAVGTKAPNGLGIYDMSGNVYEWTNDWYGSDYYASSPRNNPAGPDSGVKRVGRGGCWNGMDENMRTSRRPAYAPDFRIPEIGFRLLRTP